MSSQRHGKDFEILVRKCGGGFFKYSETKSTDLFDIPAEDDERLGIPTSVKTVPTGGGVALSDAVRFWKSVGNGPFRILAGIYDQKGSDKVFSQIQEFIIVDDYKEALWGDVSLSDVEYFHETLKKFKKGDHEEARKWAQRYKRELETEKRLGKVILNPKIDSKNQRRLQCSVQLSSLSEIVSEQEVHVESFGNIELPLTMKSPRREFSKKDNKND